MTRILHDIPADQAEYLRQELAAALLPARFLATAKPEHLEAHARDRVRQILGMIKMLDQDFENDWPCCETCGKAIGLDERSVSYSDEELNIYTFCEGHADDGGSRDLPHNPKGADRHIEAAEKWLAEQYEV